MDGTEDEEYPEFRVMDGCEREMREVDADSFISAGDCEWIDD
jgi:hypothetical protein